MKIWFFGIEFATICTQKYQSHWYFSLQKLCETSFNKLVKSKEIMSNTQLNDILFFLLPLQSY